MDEDWWSPDESPEHFAWETEVKARARAAIAEADAWEQRTGVARFRKRAKRAKEAYAEACMDLDSTPPTTPAGAGALVAYVLADSNGCSKMLIWHEWALYNVAEALKDMTPGSRLILEADDD